MSTGDERVPGADGMRACATGFVARVTARNRLPLDYSERSLRIVDFLVDGLRKGGADLEGARETLFGLGAYVGEVLVRRAGAVWVDLDADQRAYFGQPVGVRMPDGRVWNPVGRVHNRFTTGDPEDSLRTFYLTLHGRTRPSRRPPVTLP
ncbi:hypothetical protein [Streptomyces cylindrosporus]|uniref:DUF3806 domain-containing protein n=1 Tax=Streptomyces cylindrosporus TaxID=2927583 RepID=A0ABS9YFH7_9ACTN|nr:hypothetical protein [Streptomyces cylindrosporus]MCI3275977.1 hypothetical protein [Streptomyces cylindrosporus]